MFLNPDIEMQLHQKVNDGLYPSKDFAIEEAVKLLNRKDEYVRFINKAIEEAELDVANGNMFTAEEVEAKMAEVKRKFLANKNEKI